MKKILVVIGGGRPNGNTNQLVDSFIKGATEVGLLSAYHYIKMVI